jgi:hypothetical protein
MDPVRSDKVLRILEQDQNFFTYQVNANFYITMDKFYVEYGTSDFNKKSKNLLEVMMKSYTTV